MLTAQGSIESAVEAMRMGAYDYLPKPVDPARLRTILQNASRQMSAAEVERWRRRGEQVRETGVLGPLVGSSPQMKAIYNLIERVAPSNVSRSGDGRERDGQGAGGAQPARSELAAKQSRLWR